MSTGPPGTPYEQVRGAVLAVLDEHLGDDAFDGHTVVSPGKRALVADQVVLAIARALVQLDPAAGRAVIHATAGRDAGQLAGRLPGALAPESVRCPDCARRVDRPPAEGGCTCQRPAGAEP